MTTTQSAPSGTVDIATPAGTVRGSVSGGVARFLGVPFAAPPVGALRFAPPQPAPPWPGVRDATAPGPNAPQSERGVAALDLAPLVGSGPRPGDDYLTVDVWTPDPHATGLPVMVFVHGGAFIGGEPGSPAYDGTALARAGVVLVSVTYRLGVEGFLPLPGGATNLGLRDQIAALAWVRDTVAAFGGDPGQVTLFGESAGAMSIGCLLGSPLTTGLFRRAIVQSGGAEMARSVESAARIAAAVASELGVTPDAAGLRSRSVADALDAQAHVSDPAGRPDLREADGIDPGHGLGVFLPVLGDDVLPGPPLEAIAAGSAAGVELVVGSNHDEMNLYFVPSGVVDLVSADQVRAMVGAAGAGMLDGVDAAPGETLVRVLNELVFHGPTRRLAEAHAASGGATYVYDFAWRSGAFDGRLGACHGVELPFVFGTLASAVGPTGLLGEDPPESLSESVRAAWVAFARTGDPGWPAHPHVEVLA